MTLASLFSPLPDITYLIQGLNSKCGIVLRKGCVDGFVTFY